MADLDTDLLTRDVDGRALHVRGTPRQAGARLSKNFKKVAAAVFGLMSGGILIGIFTAGDRREGSDGSGGDRGGSNSAMVGQTQPDLDAMERNAHHDAPRDRDAAHADAAGTGELTETGGPQKSGGMALGDAVADRTTLRASQTAADPRQKYQQWLVEQQYKVLEAQGLAAQSAPLAKLAPEGSERAFSGSAAAPAALTADKTLSQLLQTGEALQGSPGQSVSNPPTSLPGLLSSVTALAPPAGPRASEGSIPSTAESQTTNRSFLEQQSQTSNNAYLGATVQPSAADHELFAGSIIPAVLVTGIESDLPGSITAQVRQTVYDSRHPDIVLIPQGTRLIGLYTSQIAYGQQRVLVAWNRLMFPNGSTLELGGMEGTDSLGESGVADQINNHYARIFGSAILMSTLGVGAELSQPQNSGVLTSSSTSQQMAAAVANELNQVGTTLLNKNLGIQPTITIRPGYVFDVLVSRTIIVQPYADSP